MRNNLQGAILLARKTIESDIFFNKPDKWFKIWIFILTNANHKNNHQFKRSECFTQYKEIKFYTKAKLSSIDHCIRWLKSANMITTQKATRGLYIKVLNYDKYQQLLTYKGISKSETKSDIKSEIEAKQKRNRSDTINKNDKNDKNDNIYIVSKTDEIYSFENKLNELLTSKRRDLHIIGLYWKYKDFVFDNEKQYQAGLKRELRSAKALVGYMDEQIIRILDFLKDADFKWTLETVHKYINEKDLKKFNKEGGITIDDVITPSYAKKWQK